jgi:hypothetical protein
VIDRESWDWSSDDYKEDKIELPEDWEDYVDEY